LKEIEDCINRDLDYFISMSIDSFWASQMQEYIGLFKVFRDEIKNMGIHDENKIETYWLHFKESVCDCEGCREASDCIIHISLPEDWETEE
jgi:hypothetical protein